MKGSPRICGFWIVLLVLWFLPPRLARALDPSKALAQYSRHTWTIEEGLPQSSVQAILQSRSGYLWLATQGGLARFDGVRFDVFDRANTPELTSNFICCLAEDTEGTLWVGTHGGVLRIAADGEVSSFTTNDGLVSNLVSAVFVDSAGTVWIGTRDGGLQGHHEDGDLEVYRAADGLADDRVMSLAETPDGSLWIGTRDGLTRRCEGHSDNFGKKDGLPGDTIGVLHVAQNGDLWVGTGSGLGRFHQGTWEVQTVADGLPDNAVWSVLEDRDGNIWVATSAGLGRLSEGRWSVASSNQGLPSHLIRALHEDRDGGLWVGTFDTGVWRLEDGAFTSWGRTEGLAYDTVATVLEDRDGNLWIGSLGGGLDRMNDGEVRHFDTADGLTSDQVWSLAKDPAGGLWVGTFSDGLNLLMPGEARFRRFGSADGLSSRSVKTILAEAVGDPQGGLWVGTGSGLDHFPGGQPDGLPGANRHLLDERSINALHRSHTGDLWVGTLGDGLVRLHHDEITTYTIADGLGSNIIHGIHEDQASVLWLATRDGGLCRYQNGAFTTYTARHGLPDDTLHGILEDDFGRLWMGTNRGIFWLPKDDLQSPGTTARAPFSPVSYGTEDGLRSREASGGSQPAGWRGSDGRLWFATGGGVSMVDPARLEPRPAPSPVVIQELRIDGRSRHPASTVHIAADAEKLEIHYAALSFYAPAKIRFRYRLEGFEDSWVEAGERRQAFYTKIPPGLYRFVVTASNNGRKWNNQPAVMELRIEPHFYQSPWFSAAMVLAGVFAVAGLWRWRMGFILRRERELARRVQESLAQIRVLEGMLPICGHCKRIRDDHGYWNQLESYISKHSQASFSHSMCPNCLQDFYPDLVDTKSKTINPNDPS